MEYGVASLFAPACLWALAEVSRLRANEAILVLLLSERRLTALKRGLSRLMSDCVIDAVSAILAFALVGDNEWAAPVCVGWLLCNSKNVAIFFVPEWQPKSLKRCLRGHALLGVACVKATSCYVETSTDAGMG